MNEVEEIRRLIARYCHVVDDRRIDDMAELFTDDVLLEAGKASFRGLETVIATTKEATADSPPGRHMCANSDITVEGDHARSLTDWVYFDSTLTPIRTGRYDDEFRREESGWRISRRRIVYRRTSA